MIEIKNIIRPDINGNIIPDDKLKRLSESGWDKLPLKERIKRIKIFRKIVSGKSGCIARVISAETKRPVTEILSQEILPVLEMCRYCGKKFPGWLNTGNKRYLRPGFIRRKNYMIFEPIGIAGCFSPANFPFSLGIMSTVYAIAAGNKMILKTSERSVQVSNLIEELFNEAGLTDNAVAVINGGKETGRAIVQNPSVKLIIFFGSGENGKEAASLCRTLGKEYIIEAGGGTTAFVSGTADIKVAAAGIVWSTLYANGASCVRVNKVIIEPSVKEYFLKEFCNWFNRASDSTIAAPPVVIKLKDERTSTNEEIPQHQFHIICSSNLELLNADEDSLQNRILIIECEDFNKAVRTVNRYNKALGISFWDKDIKKAVTLAEDIESGMTWINDVGVGLPSLPWLDGKGKGMLFSKYSLSQFVKVRWISVNPSLFLKKKIWWFPYTKSKQKFFETTAKKGY